MCVVVVLTFAAETVRDAVLRALEQVEDAVGESASGLKVLPTWVYTSARSSSPDFRSLEGQRRPPESVERVVPGQLDAWADL